MSDRADRTPTVSVLMPAYNAGRYLAEAVESILDQDFADLELVVIDDGSTDDTRVILDRFAERDPRVRPISRPNTGIVGARNDALKHARGEFIAVLDADDVAMPERLGRQVAYLRQHPDCLAVGSAALVIDPDGDPLDLWFQETSHEAIDAQNLSGAGAAICHSSAMMRRETVLETGGYRAPYEVAEDLDLWLRLAERGRLANLPEPLVKYRTHPLGACHARNSRLIASARGAVEDARRRRGLAPPPPPSPETAPKPAQSGPMRADHHRKWGWWALRAGFVPSARKHARASLAHRPLSPESWRLLYCSIRGR